MYDIVITEFIDPRAVDDLRRDFNVHYDRNLADDPDAIVRHAADAPALIVRNRTQVRGKLLDGLKKLKAIGRLGVGLDNIDMDECTRRGIRVFPATGANSVSVAEYVIAAMMVGLRNVWQANAAVLAGKWPRNDLMFHEVAGKRLGMIGFGGIGRAVAQRARALELDLCGYDPAIPPNAPVWSEFGTACVDLDTLFRTSDIISLHVPLTDGTRNLIDANSISRMKPTAFIDNAAALKAGKLGGAALDVFDEEPLRKGSVFDGVPSLLLTPHIAGVTREANARVSLVTVRNVRKALGASQ